MNEDTTIPPPPGLAEMNQAYDSAFSYVVIEQRLEAGGASGFQKVDDALFGLKTEIVDQELVADPRTGDKRLVIKMKHQETEEIMLAFLGAGLKENYHCYVY
ncbi:MAG: hypothetical protein ABFS43_17630 [Thermodesulfobacteriota bacterium]